MKKLIYISLAALAFATPNIAIADSSDAPLTQDELYLINEAFCSLSSDFDSDEIEDAIEDTSKESLSEDRVETLAQVAMSMKLIPGNREVLCQGKM